MTQREKRKNKIRKGRKKDITHDTLAWNRKEKSSVTDNANAWVLWENTLWGLRLCYLCIESSAESPTEHSVPCRNSPYSVGGTQTHADLPHTVSGRSFPRANVRWPLCSSFFFFFFFLSIPAVDNQWKRIGPHNELHNGTHPDGSPQFQWEARELWSSLSITAHSRE